MTNPNLDANDPEQTIGLLPHEAAFVARLLPVMRSNNRNAQEAVGEANANSGGDWAFDDPATQAAAQEAVLSDAARQQFEALHKIGLGNIFDYPGAEDPIAQPGSRVTIQTPSYEETIDLVTRRIPGIPTDKDPDEFDIEPVSVQSALGKAVVGHTVDADLEWKVGDRRFSARITSVDQTAQLSFFSALMPEIIEILANIRKVRQNTLDPS